MGGVIDATRRAATSGGAALVLLAAATAAAPADNVLHGLVHGIDATGFERGGGPGELPALGAGRRPDLTLLWYDPTALLPPGARDSAGQEVRGIFRGLGVEVEFTVAAPETTYGEGPQPEIPVILLGEDPVRERRPQRVMGLVVRNQRPMRAVWAFLEPVRWTLGLAQRGPVRPVAGFEEQDLGLAIGRVVAHEVIHAIAPEEPHSRDGLMNHSLDRAFLLGRRADLDTRCARVFLSRLQALRSPQPDADRAAGKAAVAAPAERAVIAR
jgi:hypothetical protein